MHKQVRDGDTSVSIRDAYLAAVNVLGARPDVTAIDVGPKYKAGKPTEMVCVRVHVVHKRTKRSMGPVQVIPSNIDGVPTDVIQAAYVRQGTTTPLPRIGRAAPARPGLSIGAHGTYSGTLGAIVYDGEGQPCVLSAGHVLVRDHARIGDVILQPGPADGGRHVSDELATLYRFHTPGPWGDAAIARLLGTRAVDASIVDLDVTPTSANFPTLGQVLTKSGRTTGVTRGRVDGIGRYYYSSAPAGVDGFRLRVEGFDGAHQELSAAGDSGALWLGSDDLSVGYGLHCAGEVNDPANEWAVACGLQQVLSTLQVSLTRTA
jgi:hypothetical protein